MKSLFALVFILAISNPIISQSTKEDEVKKIVEDFFEAFHRQDSITMQRFVADDVLLQTTGKNKAGETIFRTTPIEKLYESIVSIPDSVAFEEKLTSWNIQVDRTMANVWVGYEFWLNVSFSHCGINSFQLVNFNGTWKIIYLIDTRGKTSCLKK